MHKTEDGHAMWKNTELIDTQLLDCETALVGSSASSNEAMAAAPIAATPTRASPKALRKGLPHPLSCLAAFLTGVGLYALAGTAMAQQAAAPQVLSELSVKRVVVIHRNSEVRESLEAAAQAQPGDTLEYVARYRNQSLVPVQQLEATLPIPQGTRLVLNTANPTNAAKPAPQRASLDGVRYAPIPLKRMVRQSDGREVEQLVPLEEYRYVRWSPQRLAPGADLSVSARVMLVSEATTAAPVKR
jgi:uncharacterized repeat protein (TIGR01451 family)